MGVARTLLAHDARGVMRDNVMLMNIGLSFVGMAVITVIGALRGESSWADWFPFLVILAVISNPPGYGFLFGLLMVDERDSGVRGALAVTPLPATRMLLIRCVTSTVLMVLWPLTTVYVMNATWQALHLPFEQVLAVVAMLALLAPVTSLAVASYASNKVEALAIFKGLNFAALAPLALYFVPAEAAYRAVFLLSPTGWAVFGFDAFRAGEVLRGYLFLLGGAIYLSLLLALCLRAYLVSLYKTDA